MHSIYHCTASFERLPLQVFDFDTVLEYLRYYNPPFEVAARPYLFISAFDNL